MRRCIVCGSDKNKIYFNSSVTVPEPYPLKGEQSIVQCVNCGFIYSDSENTVDSYQQYYLELNKHKKRANDAQELDRSYFAKILKMLDGLNKDAVILDFGSGDLLMKSMLKDMGYENILTHDVESEGNYENKFDLILTTHTFEHILDADVVLAKLYNFLKTGGQLIIAVPNVLGYLDNYCGAYNWFDLEHINHFSPVSLTRFVESQGFIVEECISDKREVRPDLFYPEVILKCAKGETKKIMNNYEPASDIQILEKYIKKSADDYSQMLTKYKTFEGKKILLWGIGISAMRLLNHLKNLNNIDLVDADSRLWGRKIRGKTILSSNDITDVSNYDVVLITAVNYKFIEQFIKERFGEQTVVLTL